MVEQQKGTKALVPSCCGFVLRIDGQSHAPDGLSHGQRSLASGHEQLSAEPAALLVDSSRPSRNTGTSYRPSPRVAGSGTSLKSIAPGAMV